MQEIKGVQELKKGYWAKKRERRCWALECEPNRSGSSEPDRFRISYLKAISGFFLNFSFSLSFFPLYRERGSALSLEFCHRRGFLPRRVGRFRRGGRRAIAAALELKTRPFFVFFVLSTYFHSLFPILYSKISAKM